MESANESSRKHRKLPEANLSISDYISSLPDSIIHHILSFIPTKQAVATSILAKRWRSLWTEVPNLYFDSKDYRGDKMSMADAVNGILLMHKARRIDAFRLSDKDFDCTDYQLNLWVRTAVARDVRVLDLIRPGVYSQCKYVPFKLPPRVLSCKTLVVLKLKGLGVSISASCNISLPNLEKLELDNIHYENDETLPSLISGCPFLNDLTIHILVNGSMKNWNFNITSPTIVCLSVWISELSGDAQPKSHGLHIDAPLVRNLKLDLGVQEIFRPNSWHVSEGTLAALEEADISIDSSGLSLVGRLYKVKCLKLAVYKMLSGRPPFTVIERFHNLIRLDFKGDSALLFKLLEIADNLQILVFRQDIDWSRWSDPQHVPKCLLSCLRTIRVSGFRNGFDMVRYCLINAKVLEKMEINSDTFGRNTDARAIRQKFDILKKISLYPRGSDACQLDFQ